MKNCNKLEKSKLVLTLDKDDLINLVKGVSPFYSIFNIPLIRDNGNFNDNRGWSWYVGNLKKLSDKDLIDIYIICKNSWK